MNNYIKRISNIPDFEQEGYFKGYHLASEESNVELDLIDMQTGHKYYQRESKSVHIYYVIEGNGIASINGNIYNLEKGDTIEIPVGTEYALKGQMKLIELMNPPFDSNTHIDTRENDL